MVTEEQIRQILLSPSDCAAAYRNAEKASIGGVSRIRENEARQEALSMDQLVGQLGQIAGHRYLFGHAFDYCRSRWHINRHPRIGDPGSDVACANIDFKGSLLRYPKKPLLDYHLLVRPAERHSGMVYVPIIIDLNETERKATAHLMGWASEDMLPQETEKSGVFEGAYAIGCSHLHPLPPFKWDWY